MKYTVATFVCALLLACNPRPKVGYVNIKLVFEQFVYKRELEKELTALKNQRSFILDSLQSALEALRRQIVESKSNELIEEFAKKRDDFIDRQQKYEDEEQNMVRQFDDKIFRQINSFIKEYGRQNDYQIIYGATISGNIMYADSTLDLTKDITAFINERYKGRG